MKEISLTESAVSRLKEYPLDNIQSTESRFYYYKREHDKSNILFKKLFLTDKERMDRKISTIERLQDSELSTYSELVIPEDYVTVRGTKSGFTIKEITGCTNLHLFLEDPKVLRAKKIAVLKKIGELLRKVQSQKQEFYFGDLQSYNFLVSNDLDIYTVDLDSSAVTSDKPLETKYIIVDKKTHGLSKYNVDRLGRAYPNKNVDTYCYNTLVLNYLAGRSLHRLSYNDYYEYISYLEKCGIPHEMIDIYTHHYTDKSNESVLDYLDCLPDDHARVDYKVYTALKNK